MVLKICGGSLRGRMLITPKGDQTRPSSTQVRSALFNILGQDCSDWRVLDLFAGSGALGFEALSRGAIACVFVESHRLALQALRRNIEDLELQTTAQIFPVSVQQGLQRCKGSFDLIVADPPYHLSIEGISAATWVAQQVDRLMLLSDTGWLVIEAAEGPPELSLQHLSIVDIRRYGDTTLWLFRNKAHIL